MQACSPQPRLSLQEGVNERCRGQRGERREVGKGFSSHSGRMFGREPGREEAVSAVWPTSVLGSLVGPLQGGPSQRCRGPRATSDPLEPVGLEPREAHVATAAALVTGGAGRTWPPHLVRCLAQPVAPEERTKAQGATVRGRESEVSDFSPRRPGLSTVPTGRVTLGPRPCTLRCPRGEAAKAKGGSAWVHPALCQANR